MRAVIQRVNRAEVVVEGSRVGSVELGLCAFVGVGQGDTEQDASTLADKVVGLRIFEDDAQKMNSSLLEVGGALLAVSQFTLFGDVRKGKRPSFSEALEPIRAAELFARFCEGCRTRGARVETGRFRTHMLVSLENDGPVDDSDRYQASLFERGADCSLACWPPAWRARYRSKPSQRRKRRARSW